MKVSLGTIELSDEHRRCLAAHMGKRGVADRKTVVAWCHELIAFHLTSVIAGESGRLAP